MDWALLVASLALVAVTIVYTIHTKAMAGEMMKTRLLSVEPRLSLTVNMRSGTVGEIRITNIGHGPAIEPRVTLEIGANDERKWTTHMFAPGDSADFMLNDPARPHEAVTMDEAADADTVIKLEGTTLDLYGVEHVVADTLDLANWWRTIVSAQQGYREDPREITNRELKKLREAAETIHTALSSQRSQ
jgi:hypothetical protein